MRAGLHTMYYAAPLRLSCIIISRVCGRVIAYQHETPEAFGWYYIDRSFTINDPYVDGVSIIGSRGAAQNCYVLWR